ncbi:hypothetical protein F3F96_09500 [Mariprofundus sp. NF]|uniref:DUF6164 family protein n=1 Tax=Mariprofundus sp. NF TaxID=2608716 RepID=UPI0015A1393C|nr:hypothetical protein [Mariprofundus sp. NF]
MAVRLFKLRDVPDDEAEDVRLLLSEHDISFYETHAGGFGIGTPAIWLHDDDKQDQARTLIDEYQQRRSVEQQAEYNRLKAEGEQMTFFDRFRQHPVMVIVLILFSLFILYVSLSPFLSFGK